MPDFVLHTPRLSLRELTWNDLDFIAAMLADPIVMRHYPKCYSRVEAEQWLERMIQRYADDGHALWLVSNRRTGEPVGQVGLLRQFVDDTDEIGVGYLIDRPFWQQGFAREAASAVRDYAFEMLEKDRVISLIRPANIPSQRVALRIGLKPERLTKFRDSQHLVFALSRPPMSHRAEP